MRYITSRHHVYILFTPPAQKCKSYSCLYPFLRDLFSSKLWGKLNCSIMIEKNLKVAKKRPVSIHWNSWEIVWFFSSIGIVCCLCNCLAFLCSFSAKMVHQERVCVCMHVCLFNIKRSISRHRLSFPKDTFPPASRREEIFYIPAREEKQVMNRYNIPGMAFLKFVTPCKILLCVGTVYFVPPSAVVKLFLSSRCDLFFSAKKSPARGHWSVCHVLSSSF